MSECLPLEGLLIQTANAEGEKKKASQPDSQFEV